MHNCCAAKNEFERWHNDKKRTGSQRNVRTDHGKNADIVLVSLSRFLSL